MNRRRTLSAVTAVLLLLAGPSCGSDDPGDGAAGIVDAAETARRTPSSTAPSAEPPATSAHRPLARTRVIEVEMDEFAFRPGRIEVEAGETVEFRFVNTGTQVHDAFLGTTQEQQEHSEAMAQDSGGHDHHAANDAVTVEPGRSAVITRSFDAPAVLEIGCHQPGHYQSGMRLALTVA